MGVFGEQLMNAILLGCSYTLVAIGFSLFFGVMDAIVFCSGDIAIFGAFCVLMFYSLAVSLGLFAIFPFWLAVILVIICSAVVSGLLGIITHKISIKPFEGAPILMPLLSTIALGVVIREAIGLFFPQGRNPQVFPNLLVKGSLFNINSLSYRNLIMIAVTIFMLAVLFWFLNRTKTGLSMQSVSQNKEAAQMIGVNIRVIVTMTFVIGGILLSIGGFLIGSYYNIVRFDMGSMYGIKGFSAAVVGGLGNIYGAIVGGMLMAFVEVFVSGYIPGGTAYASIFAFLVVVLFMIFKPEGILGEKTIEKV